MSEIYVLAVPECGKSKIKVLQGLVSGKGSLPGLKTVSSEQRWGEGERLKGISLPLMKPPILTDLGPTLMTVLITP